MDLTLIRTTTAKALGLSVEDVSYITIELVEEYKSTAKGYGQLKDDGTPQLDGAFTAYGNSVTFEADQVYWKQDPFYPADPEVSACGNSQTCHISNSFATTFILKGRCGSGKHWFFIGNHKE